MAICLLHVSKNIGIIHGNDIIGVFQINKTIGVLHVKDTIGAFHVNKTIGVLNVNKSICLLHVNRTICILLVMLHIMSDLAGDLLTPLLAPGSLNAQRRPDTAGDYLSGRYRRDQDGPAGGCGDSASAY